MCTYFVIKSENEANKMLAESSHYVDSVGSINFYPELPPWATEDCKVRMYLPAVVSPYSRQEYLEQSVETHDNDLRKQLDLIKEQMEFSLQYRCGSWAAKIVDKMMDDIVDNETQKSEEYLVNFIDLAYDKASRMDDLSRKCMLQVAIQIKESHAKQHQKEKEKEQRATSNSPETPVVNHGAFLTLYNPNRPNINKDGEAIWIDLGGCGRRFDLTAMDGNYKDPEERKIWKQQPKGQDMRILLEPLRHLNNTSWDTTLQLLCGRLSMYHRPMWVAYFLLQASECKSPGLLDFVSPHMLSLDTAFTEVMTEFCPREALKELENFKQIRERILYGNTSGVALLCCVIQTLGCSSPGKPEQKLETIELGLSTYDEDVTAHSESLDKINTLFEQHGPDAAECESLCKPIVEVIIQKGIVAKDRHYVQCYEAMQTAINESYLTKLHVFQCNTREHKQHLQTLTRTIRLQC